MFVIKLPYQLQISSVEITKFFHVLKKATKIITDSNIHLNE